MSLLEKLGLGQKRKELAPLIGEKKKKEQEKYSLKRNPYIRAVIILFFIVISAFSLPKNPVNSGLNYSINQPWRNADLTAPFTFSIQKTDSELEEERSEIRESTSPIFRVDSNTPISIQTRLDSIYRQMQPVLDAYHEWQVSKETSPSSANADSSNFTNVLSGSGLDLTGDSWQVLLENYHEIQSSDLPPSQFIGYL